MFRQLRLAVNHCAAPAVDVIPLSLQVVEVVFPQETDNALAKASTVKKPDGAGDFGVFFAVGEFAFYVVRQLGYVFMLLFGSRAGLRSGLNG